MSAAAGLLSGIHTLIAMQRAEPHWELSDAEAKRYGQALANAMRHIPIEMAQKSFDFSMLAMTSFMIETPRIASSIQLRRGRGRGPAQVFPLHTSGTPPSNGPVNGTRPAGPAGPPATPPIAEPPQDFDIGGEGLVQ